MITASIVRLAGNIMNPAKAVHVFGPIGCWNKIQLEQELSISVKYYNLCRILVHTGIKIGVVKCRGIKDEPEDGRS